MALFGVLASRISPPPPFILHIYQNVLESTAISRAEDRSRFHQKCGKILPNYIALNYRRQYHPVYNVTFLREFWFKASGTCFQFA